MIGERVSTGYPQIAYTVIRHKGGIPGFSKHAHHWVENTNGCFALFADIRFFVKPKMSHLIKWPNSECHCKTLQMVTGNNRTIDALPFPSYLHRFKAVVACDGLVQRMSQQLYFIMPRTVNR